MPGYYQRKAINYAKMAKWQVLCDILQNLLFIYGTFR